MEIGAVGNVAAANVQRVVDSVQVSTPAASTTTSQTTVQTNNAVQQAGSPPSMEQVKQAVAEINQSMQTLSRGLQFSIDKDTDKTIVKVVDQETKKIIRQIPSEEALALAKSLDQVIGKLIHDKA